MKIGLLTYLLSRNLSYPEVVKWAASAGFESLEVDVDAFPGDRGLLKVVDLLSGGRAAVDETLNTLTRHGISIGSLFCYGPNKLDPDLEARKIAQEGLRNAVRLASLLGVNVIVTNVGSHLRRRDASRLNPWGVYYHCQPNPEGARIMQEGYEQFCESYVPLAGFASEHGVKIAFEPTPISGGTGAVAYSPETFDHVFRMAGHPALGLNFDASHLLWQRIDYLGYAARLAKEGRIFSCHAKDTEILKERLEYAGILGDGWWRSRLPGRGEVNWATLIRTLRENGYDSVMNLEHEDRFDGWDFDAQGNTVDIELAKRGSITGLEFLQQARLESAL